MALHRDKYEHLRKPTPPAPGDLRNFRGLEAEKVPTPTSDPERVFRQCHREGGRPKVRLTETAAVDHAAQSMWLRAYECPTCGWWHTGTAAGALRNTGEEAAS